MAAVGVIDQFASVVTREHGPEARLTKWLGDGFMLVYQPHRAIAQRRRPQRTGGHPFSGRARPRCHLAGEWDSPHPRDHSARRGVQATSVTREGQARVLAVPTEAAG